MVTGALEGDPDAAVSVPAKHSTETYIITFPMGASTIATRARPSRSRFIFRAVVAVLVLLLIVFLAFDFWFYRAVRAALPQVDGTIHLAGLASPVIVTYDALGVPNIAAANLPTCSSPRATSPRRTACGRWT